MVTINPIELKGRWKQGYALDLHTMASDYIGDNQFGKPLFETEHTPMGGLVYRLKYQSDLSAVDSISDTVVEFLINKWKIRDILNFIISIPPSSTQRTFQPVIVLTNSISQKTGIAVCNNALIKNKETPELKGISDPAQRQETLKGVFGVANPCIEGTNVLLVDDLYRSGVTVNMASEVLYNVGKVKNVYVLALTKTRVKQ